MVQDNDLLRVVEYVNANIREKISEKSILNGLALNQAKLKSILERAQRSLPQLINEVRINKAKELLIIDKKKNVSEVGFEVGYSDPTYFFKCFKKMVGVTAKDFQEGKTASHLELN